MKTSTFARASEDVRSAIDRTIATAIEEAWPAIIDACERAMSDNDLQIAVTVKLPIWCEGQILHMDECLTDVSEKRTAKAKTPGTAVDLLQGDLPHGQDGAAIGGLLVILAYLVMVILPFAMTRQWWWAWTWVAVGLVVGIVEIAAKVTTGKTISQQFHRWQKTHRWQAVLLVACMIAFVAWLTVGHLLMGW